MCKAIGDSAVFAILLVYLALHQSLCINVKQEELVLHEGSDILLTQEQQLALELLAAHQQSSSHPYVTQNAVIKIFSDDRRWTEGMVYYMFHSSLTGNARLAINAAIADYEAKTCLKFRKRTNETDYILFYKGSGCFSYVGKIGGAQAISIGFNCDTKGIVIHEIFHALGRWHEHSRPDRDEYVQINYQYILSKYASNFQKLPSEFVSTQGIEYDYESVMHYPKTAFLAKEGKQTITPIKETTVNIGQRFGLSQSDINHVKALYCSSDTKSLSHWTDWSAWSKCSLSCNQGIRHRSRECIGGNIVCQGSDIEYEYCNSNPCPIPATWSEWSEWSACSSTCGNGRTIRIRQCLNGHTCNGVAMEFDDCNDKPCPKPVSWGSWGPWSECSTKCEGGRQVRQRVCQNGQICPGSDTEMRQCNNEVDCQPNLVTGQWTTWTSCSRTCSGGTRMRSRNCNDSTSSNCEYDSVPCNEQLCPGMTNMKKEFQSLGCYKFISSLVISIESKTPHLQDYPPSRDNPVETCAKAAQSLGYKYFGIALGFCISGSNDVSHYVQIKAINLCQNGKGGYYNGFFMDVYQIQIQKNYSPNTFEEDDLYFSGEEPNSSHHSVPYSITLIVLLAMILIASQCS